MKNDSQDAVRKPQRRAERCGKPLSGLIKELVTCSQLGFRITIDHGLLCASWFLPFLISPIVVFLFCLIIVYWLYVGVA